MAQIFGFEYKLRTMDLCKFFQLWYIFLFLLSSAVSSFQYLGVADWKGLEMQSSKLGFYCWSHIR